MTNDAAVAWRVRIGASDVWGFTDDEEKADFYGKNSGLRYVKEALVPATTVAELRDNAAKWKSLHDAMVLVHDVQERRIGRMTAQLEAAERRVAELEAAMRSAIALTKESP